MFDISILGNVLDGYLLQKRRQEMDNVDLIRQLRQYSLVEYRRMLGLKQMRDTATDFYDNVATRVRGYRQPTKELPIATIEEIHNEIDGAAERILAQANTILAEADIDSDGSLSALARFGFKKAKGVSESLEQRQMKEIARKDASLVKMYFALYPFNKFITKDELARICRKYGLVIGEPEHFIGQIPKKNQAEILGFKVYAQDNRRDSLWRAFLSLLGRKYRPSPDRIKIVATIDQFETDPGYKWRVDENTQELKLGDPDPVVLFDIDDGYIIVSKWGAEAEIEELD